MTDASPLRVQVNACPQCGRVDTAYRRTITPEMLRFLSRLHQHWARGDRNPIPIRDITKSTGPKASSDASYLVCWGLVEKPGTGLYKLTPRGAQFVRGNVKVHRYLYIKGTDVWKTAGGWFSWDDFWNEPETHDAHKSDR